MGRPFFLRQRSYHFRRNWGYISFQFPFKSFYLFPRPFFETSKHEMDKFLLLGTHTRKRIMVALPLTTSFSFMNFIVIEIHVLPRQNFELAILLPNRQRLTSVERLIHSDRYEDPTPLHCQNPCSILKRVDLCASLMVQSSSCGAPFLLGPQRKNVELVPTVHHGRKNSQSRDR